MSLNYNKILYIILPIAVGNREYTVIFFDFGYPVVFSSAECLERVSKRRFPFSGGEYGKEAYENRDFPARRTPGQI